MTNATPSGPVFSPETERNLVALEDQLRTLVTVCERLSTKNATVTQERDQLIAEQEALKADHRRTRNRIDAIVARLKGIEDEPR